VILMNVFDIVFEALVVTLWASCEMLKRFWPLLVSVAAAAMRVIGCRHQAFQAVAHLWVGGLIGAWLTGRRRRYLRMAVALTIVEIAVAAGDFINLSRVLAALIEQQSRLYLWSF